MQFPVERAGSIVGSRCADAYIGRLVYPVSPFPSHRKKLLNPMRENSSARASASFTNTPPPPWPVVDAFCRNFNPEHARFAHDVVRLF